MITNATALPRTARGAATRARIVDAATDLVRAHGVANTTIDAVIEASRVSKSQIYHYFDDKDDLVLAVIQRQAECVLGTHEELLRKLNSLAGLRSWRDAVVELTRQTNCAGGCPLGSLAAELSETPRTRAALAESFARWASYFETAFARMQTRTGKRPSGNLKELSEAMLASLQGGLLLAQTMRSTTPLELALDMAIDYVAARLRLHPPENRSARRE
ncbi:TetR/AcrR family transcriptional regulator [Bradyrhizobium prioriisuperbiae]|uniref:TetR/AcrR family transcriptional regulator n=1 Tax=Bradyrhizobium prioriisuperbiae TaxID=2854389 RepID=UPI0028EA4C63|nr:TetR/AcrR family transcriptional regulator [Bradyrhizobium prioritasuperba]